MRRSTSQKDDDKSATSFESPDFHTSRVPQQNKLAQNDSDKFFGEVNGSQEFET